MTTREICERLMNLRDYARGTDTWLHDNAERQNLHLRNAVKVIAKSLGELLLDIAAPEKEPADKLTRRLLDLTAPEAEEQHHGVVVHNGCLNCGGDVEVVHNGFGTGEDWAYCSKCDVSFRLKRGEGR